MPARRFSLTLLLVAPIIGASTLSSDDLGSAGAELGVPSLTEPQTQPPEEWGSSESPGDLESSTEPTEAYVPGLFAENYGEFAAWLRWKRDLDAPRDDLEKAEQVTRNSESPGDSESSTEPTEAYLPGLYAENYGEFAAWLRWKRDLDAPRDDLEKAEQVTRNSESPGDSESSTEPTEAYVPGLFAENYGEFAAWLRWKRDLDAPGDDLETAEQVLFRPTFRYKHLVKEREKHQKLQQELRRQFSQNSVVSVASSALPSRKYYSVYPQQNQIYTQLVPTAQGVYSPPSSLPQKVYSQQTVYPSQTSPPQRVYPPQPSPVQGVYSPQAPVTQKEYLVNPPRIVPNYPQLLQSAPQFPTQYSQGLRQ